MYRDIAKMTTATSGTGTMTLGSAVAGFLDFDDAGYTDGERVTFVIEDGNDREVSRGIYTTSGTTLTRDEVLSSTNAGAKISLSGSATVFVGLSAQDMFNTDPQARIMIRDEFIGGTTTSGRVGDLGWQFTNGTMSLTGSETNGHPGIFTHSYNSTTALTGVFLGATGNRLFHAGSIDEVIWILKITPIGPGFDNTMNIRFGVANTYGGATLTDGIVVERLAADTSFYGATWNGSAFTRTTALLADAAVDTTWHQWRIKRYSASNWGFKVDNGTELFVTSGNLPDDTDIVLPFIGHYNSSGASTTSLAMDYFHAKLFPTARF